MSGLTSSTLSCKIVVKPKHVRFLWNVQFGESQENQARSFLSPANSWCISSQGSQRREQDFTVMRVTGEGHFCVRLLGRLINNGGDNFDNLLSWWAFKRLFSCNSEALCFCRSSWVCDGMDRDVPTNINDIYLSWATYYDNPVIWHMCVCVCVCDESLNNTILM
jgi:hypothetical protein